MNTTRMGAIAACCALWGCASTSGTAPTAQAMSGSRTVPALSVDGLQFRDLNRNGVLDAYEDWRLTPRERARNLVGMMTLKEKAGVMIHGTIVLDAKNATLDVAATRKLLEENRINTFLTRQNGDAARLAATHNTLQALAEQSRLGIPVSISSDPRHHFLETVGQGVAAGSFSTWPNPLGLAAIGDPAVTHTFGDIVRQEYGAVGIAVALSPQADLATEPRWSRAYATFGEDADVASRHVQAYVEGLQNGAEGIRQGSVVAVVKHWAGYGAAKDGWDSHNPYGKHMAFPGGNFAYHLKPFDGAFAAKVGSIMPTYSVPDGEVSVEGITLDHVGGAFNKPLLTDLLRGRRGFDGVVLSDWAVTRDCAEACIDGVPAGAYPLAFFPKWGTPWGVEMLSERARMVKAVDAGVDQFGGTDASALLVDAVQAGELAVELVDRAVMRILLQKFEQGLFENPFVDEAQAGARVNTAAFQAAALDAQRRSLVLLQNKGGVLPLRAAGLKVYLRGIDADTARRHGLQVVAEPELADVAIVRAAAPFERLHPNYIFGLLTHEGSLAFRDGNADYDAIKRISAKVPTIVTVYLDRPALLANIVDKAAAVIANFGIGDAALLDVLTGIVAPQGKLPVELPSTEAAVAAQRPDLPHDSAVPLFPFGYGMTY
ncbi:glycoside hydrolase family 3 C-terminal domain-containing protein [Telluria mixta]|uniref:beta-glucosidase n=1 Tax=Telluria mixta TaxID=34071 RepID=A0ABT2BTB6_9BURK|nr:glycoside hydrolase family 3 N-terminal domain-containing protein [Telluria mixta]MCS0627916.1 glycoside hydrolase family 3 C-terminal domain-containing protein [Telluria mixta]WEM93965.1 glycoside hydrolase family 3 N-terminal domain-containing protein [Telluria mixta]